MKGRTSSTSEIREGMARRDADNRGGSENGSSHTVLFMFTVLPIAIISL